MALLYRALVSTLTISTLVAAGHALQYQGHIISSPTSWYNVWFATPEEEPAMYPEEQGISRQQKRHFGYAKSNGPETWGLDFPSCAGYSQSPIDLDSAAMIRLVAQDQLNWEGYWREPVNMTLTNTGHTIQLSGKWNEDETPFVNGGPLEEDYIFAQIHFHWGTQDEIGSEHTVHNVSFPMEMHVVHYKREYGNPEEAGQFDDGLVVASHLFELSDTQNIGLDNILQNLESVRGADLQVAIDPFELDILHVPFERDYVTYSGSLTTPPCNEAVTWLVSARPLPISPQQMDQLRSFSSVDIEIQDNFRPTQPRNGRPVFYVS